MSLFIVGGGLRLLTRLHFGFPLGLLLGGARLRLLAGLRLVVRDVGRRLRLRPPPPIIILFRNDVFVSHLRVVGNIGKNFTPCS